VVLTVLTVLMEPAVAQGALAMKRATAPEKQGRTMIGLFSRRPWPACMATGHR
jgi:hypothetical protein